MSEQLELNLIEDNELIDDAISMLISGKLLDFIDQELEKDDETMEISK